MRCLNGILLVFLIKTPLAENRLIGLSYETEAPFIDQDPIPLSVTANVDNNSHEKLSDLKQFEDHDNQYELDKIEEKAKRPCAIIVLSNIHNPNMQSLLRKYRYDSNGILIPSSVKYFIKMPQGVKTSPLLVPLNNRAFSPLGSFVRYYKEVPPIPHAW